MPRGFWTLDSRRMDYFRTVDEAYAVNGLRTWYQIFVSYRKDGAGDGVGTRHVQLGSCPWQVAATAHENYSDRRECML